jgi:hypothetical protein
MTAATSTPKATGSFAIPVRRLCGTRIFGGAYVETEVAPKGLPIEVFLLDPPFPVPQDKTFSRQGVTLDRDESGTYHIYDWVGSAHYPNVADVVEECRRFGASRRAERIDYSLLTEKSRLILIHERAIVRSVGDVRPVTPGAVPYGPPYKCPMARLAAWAEQEGKGPHQKAIDKHAAHRVGGTMCAGIWWEDLEPGTVEPHPHDADRSIRRTPSFEYEGRARSRDKKIVVSPGFFATLPIGRIVVVEDGERGTHEEKLERLGTAKIRVDLVRE